MTVSKEWELVFKFMDEMKELWRQEVWRKRIQDRGTNCDACYGERTEDCPKYCLTSHIRFSEGTANE